MGRLTLILPVLVVTLVIAVAAAWAGDREPARVAVTGQPIVAASPAAPLPTPAATGGPAADARTGPTPPTEQIASPGPRPDPAWVADVATRTGIDARAMTAYAAASLRLRDEQPACRLGWTTLAGIGQIETGHGQGRLGADGRSAGAIHGPELDGTSGNAAISEDGEWDRARGPMQFIASTWQRWASDGDGDGTADVDDVDDAAYAAARYLCASGGDLTTGPGWSRAVFSYNHSDHYVRAVLAAANAYAARSTA